MLNPYQKSHLTLRKTSWVKKEVPHVNIVSIYRNLTGNVTKTSGKAEVGLCCFHEERHPSMALYRDTSSFYCFSCGESGNVWKLIMHIKGVDFKEALNIGEKYGN